MPGNIAIHDVYLFRIADQDGLKNSGFYRMTDRVGTGIVIGQRNCDPALSF
jgi:hypothetical protein